MVTKKGYRKSLGLFDLVSLGLGGTIGSGIFIVPGIAAGIAGSSSLIAWLFASLSASCVMYSLAKASSKYPSTGAFYLLFSKVFGKRISISLVFLYLVSSVFGISTIASGIGQYIFSFGFQDINLILIVEIFIIIVFCMINIKGLYLSTKTEIILTFAKISPLIILSVVLLPFLNESNFFPFYPASSFDFLKAIVIVYWSFTGFEIAALFSDEIKGGQKIVYRSLKIVIGITIFTYIFLNISLIGSVGSYVLANSPAPLATAYGLILKESNIVIGLIGIITMLSAINAYIVGTTRVLQNISYQLELPILKDLTSSGSPLAATMTVAIITSILLLFLSNQFEELASISVITTLLPYFFVCLSAYKIFFDDYKTKIISSLGAFSVFAIFIVYFAIPFF
ncbi:MAG TPA: APC family permease [Nitrososphaeraceae archaeon]|nr:APC family permease [Nitrososphaeraceae archaeon]